MLLDKGFLQRASARNRSAKEQPHFAVPEIAGHAPMAERRINPSANGIAADAEVCLRGHEKQVGKRNQQTVAMVLDAVIDPAPEADEIESQRQSERMRGGHRLLEAGLHGDLEHDIAWPG